MVRYFFCFIGTWVVCECESYLTVVLVFVLAHRIGTDVDPKYDHLLRFQGEEEDATLFSIGGLAAVFLVILYILMRLVLGKSHTIQIAVRRAQNYANFKQSKARTV